MRRITDPARPTRHYRQIMRRLALAVLILLLLVNVATATGGCSSTTCIPRVGSWSAPSPQKLTFLGKASPLTLKVDYRRKGKKTKSTYGNTLADFRVYLRYSCNHPSSPWTETGFAIDAPIAISRSGKVEKTIPANFAFREHRLILRFKRSTFTGRLSGTALGYEDTVCSTSVSFSGKLKR